MSNVFNSLQNKMPKGVIFLCNHGYNGSEENFSGTLKIIQKYSNVLDAKAYLDDYIYYKDDLNNNIYKDLKQNAYNYVDKMLFIRTRFQNKVIGDLDNQAKEVDIIIENIKTCLGEYKDKFEFVLIGHSKGGLVNMEYALTHPDKVRRIISINTPYNGALYWVMQGWKLSDPNIGSQIVAVGNKWNDTVYFMRPKLSCISTNKDNKGNDGLVGNDSAFGEPVGNIFLDVNSRTYKGIFSKELLSGEGNGYEHAGCLGTEELVYALLIQIQKQFKETTSGGTGSGTYY